MAAKSLKRLRYRLEYVLVCLLQRLFVGLGWKRARWLGGVLGQWVSYLLPSKRQVADRNLGMIFPQWNAKERRQMVNRVWRNLGFTAAECFSASPFGREEVLSKVCFERMELLDSLFRKQQGVLIHYGHYANWELAAWGLTRRGVPLAAIVRRVGNPWLDGWVNSIRKKHGLTVWKTSEMPYPAIRWLRQGKCLVVLMDQNTSKGELVPFLGRPAHTTTLTALLSLKFSIPILPAHGWRDDGKLVVTFDEPICYARQREDFYQDVLLLTEELNRYLERCILKRPEEWLWIHNRWKPR